MDFISDLDSRLLKEVRKFTDLSQSQLTNVVDNISIRNWTINCARLISAASEIQENVLERCLTNNHSNFPEDPLGAMQPLVEKLGQTWFELRAQIISIGTTKECQKLQDKTETLLGQLLRGTFLIVRQPPRVIKTNTIFNATVRSLAVGLLTSSPLEPIKVHCCILNESQARATTTGQPPPYHLSTAGEIANQETVFLRTTDGQFLASFDYLSVKRISRTIKGHIGSVLDEKLAITFTTEVKCAGGQLTFNLQTLSLPVVVINYGTQETNAWATIVWDNYFASHVRQPFVVPVRVPWVNVSQMLSNLFAASTGCHLDHQDLRFLACKAFRETTSIKNDPRYLAWYEFAKIPLPNLTFTLWEWFYALIKLVKDHLKGLWTPDNRLIRGFINRYQCDNHLRNKPDGTFLIRFSETYLGCLSIAYTVNDEFNQKSLLSLGPFTHQDLTNRSLADRLSDLEHLKILHPNIPKNAAFGPFYTSAPAEPVPRGYAESYLVTKVTGWKPGDEHFDCNSQDNLINYNQPESFVGANANSHFTQINGTETSLTNDSMITTQSPDNAFIDNDLDRLIQEAGLTFDDFNLVNDLDVNCFDDFTEFNYNFNC